jgi:tetratricopeptide (TPR) repeat protein
MTNELSQHGIGIIGLQDVHDSTVNITQILGKSVEYKDLLNQLETQRELFAYLPEDKIEKRLQISQTIAQLEAQIEQFKIDVTRLAAEFNRIEINTDRLRRAKAHFEQGEIAAARAVFDSEHEQMQDENNRLVREKERYEQGVLPKLKHSSDEYYLRALLERTAYDNPNWLDDACEYFERSINTQATENNVFWYARFLQQHNLLDEAEHWYQRYLDEFGSVDQPNRAKVLNNLANLHCAKTQLQKAEAEYVEALAIYQELATENPADYLVDVAGVLNNLGSLHMDKNELEKADARYTKALATRRELAAINPLTYLPYVADTLNNLGILYKAKNDLEKAEGGYAEALAIRRKMAAINPIAYLPDVAKTLNNMADLYRARNELAQAEMRLGESLAIWRECAAINHSAHLPDLARTLSNFALFHLHDVPCRERSIRYSMDAVTILLPMIEAVPYTQEYFQNALVVLKRWGVSGEECELLLLNRILPSLID